MKTAEKTLGAGVREMEPNEEEICGAVCPKHGDICGVSDGPDMAPLFNTLTLADHRAGKSRHLCAGGPTFHFWSD